MRKVNRKATLVAEKLASSRPGSGATRKAMPFKMPSSFDQATIQHLINNIESDNNSVILRVGYFARRQKEAFPAEQALEAIRYAVSRADVGSVRWFKLMEVLGFAALHVNSNTAPLGIEAYRKVLAHASSTQDPRSTAACARAAYDCIRSIANYRGDSFANPIKARIETIGDLFDPSLAAYITLVEQGNESHYPMPWSAAFEALKAGQVPTQAPVLIQSALKRQASRLHIGHTQAQNSNSALKIATLLQVSAAIHLEDNPAQSLSLVEQAWPLASAMKPRPYLNFLSFAVDVATKADKPARAITAQMEIVRLSDAGRVKLAALFYNQGNRNSYLRVVHQISSSPASDDLFALASTLVTGVSPSGRNTPGPDVATRLADASQLLTAYLKRPAPSDKGLQKDGARLLLTRLLIQSGKMDEAIKVLHASPTAAHSVPGQRLAKALSLAQNDQNFEIVKPPRKVS